MSILKITSQYWIILQLLKGICLVLFFMALVAVKPFKKTMLQQEYQVRAVFLFNFTQFIEWPSAAFPKENSPLVIGVLGQDPFGNLLDETVVDEEIKGHPLIVQRFSKVEEISTCHILYINLAKPDQLKHVFQSLKNKNVLTVGDASNFAKYGGMIRFYTEENKTRIRINLNAVRDAELIISSKLLRLADIVEPQKN